MNKKNLANVFQKIYSGFILPAFSVCKNLIIQHYLLVGLLALLIYYLPYIILGENSYFRVHDNLDSELVYRVLLANKENLLKAGGTVDQVMNGLPSFCLPSPLSFTAFLFAILPPLKAYLVNDFLVRLVGFIGMYALLTTYFITKNDSNKNLAFFIALCFAFIPFYTIHGLSVAGQPLILFIFLNLLNRKNDWWNYALIIAFVFYSSFVLSGIFICIVLGVILIIDILNNKRINFPFLSGLIILSFGYLFVEHQLIASFFFNDNFISHRTDFVIKEPIFKSIWARTKDLFFNTHYHSGSLYTGIIILSTFLSLFISRKKNRNLMLITVVILLILIIYFANNYFKFWFGNNISILKEFQWNRFYFLLPSLWIILFAISLSILFSKKYLKFLVPVLLFCQFKSIFNANDDYNNNILKLKGHNIFWAPSFKQFYAEELFDKIGQYIQKDKKEYRVVSIGMHPAIAQFNGFYTLDSYQTNYPLEYKHQFRKIIEKELDKNDKIKKNFDDWGNRCYLYTAEYGTEFIDGKDKNATKNTEINNLELNTAILREMGCQYIFSANKVNNFEANNLSFEKIFTNKSSYYNIYLYKINN